MNPSEQAPLPSQQTELQRSDSNPALLNGDGDKKPSTIKSILLNTSTHKKAKRKISWGAIKIREFIKNDHSWARQSEIKETSRAMSSNEKDIRECDSNEDRSALMTPREIVHDIDFFEKSDAPTQGNAPPSEQPAEPQQQSQPEGQTILPTEPTQEQTSTAEMPKPQDQFTEEVTEVANYQPEMREDVPETSMVVDATPQFVPQPPVTEVSALDISIANNTSMRRRFSEHVKQILGSKDDSFAMQSIAKNQFPSQVNDTRRKRISVDALDLSGLLFGGGPPLASQKESPVSSKRETRRWSNFARETFKTAIVNTVQNPSSSRLEIEPPLPGQASTSQNIPPQLFSQQDGDDWRNYRLNSSIAQIPGISNSPITSSSFYNFSAIPAEVSSNNLNLSQSVVRTLSPILAQQSTSGSKRRLDESHFDNGATSFNVGTLAGLAEDYPSMLNSQELRNAIDCPESEQAVQPMEVLSAIEEEPRPVTQEPSLKRKADMIEGDQNEVLKHHCLKRTKYQEEREKYRSPSLKDRNLLRLDTVERRNLLKELEAPSQPQDQGEPQSQPETEPQEEIPQDNNNIFGVGQNGKESSMVASPTFKEVNDTGADQGHDNENSYLANLVMKSPTINNLQKKFLVSFLSPRPDPSQSPWTGAKMMNFSGSKKLDFSNCTTIMPLLQNILQHKGSIAMKISLEYKKLKQISYDLKARVEEQRKKQADLNAKLQKLKAGQEVNKKQGEIDQQARQAILAKVPSFMPFYNNVLGYKVIKVLKNKGANTFFVNFSQTYLLELTVRQAGDNTKFVEALAFNLRGSHKLLDSHPAPSNDQNNPQTGWTNPLKNKQMFMSLLGNTARCYFLKKGATSFANILNFIAFKIKSLEKLADLIDDLIIRHNIVNIHVDTVTCIMNIAFRLKNIPSKKIAFRLQLAKNWFEEIEMEMQDEELVKRLNSKQIESLNKRLITIFNREIANSSLDKLAKMFSHLDAFRLISP